MGVDFASRGFNFWEILQVGAFRDNRHIVLDCTLRDGGHALEDIFARNPKGSVFEADIRVDILRRLIESKVDVIEVGSITDGVHSRPEFSVFRDVKEAAESVNMVDIKSEDLAVIYRDPHRFLGKIPEWHQKIPKIARVIIRYHDLESSFNFCRDLADKGYRVFVQPMATIQYKEDELSELVNLANEIDAFALYIVDTYGSMTMEDIKKIAEIFDLRLDRNIRLGLHAHDNLQLAFANTLGFLDLKLQRLKIVDSTLYGMGLGAGNCRTEILLAYLNEAGNGEYDVCSAISGCEIVEQMRDEDQTWGIGMLNSLPALKNVATKFVHRLRYEHRLSYDKIYQALDFIPPIDRQQYSKEAMDQLIITLGLQSTSK